MLPRRRSTFLTSSHPKASCGFRRPGIVHRQPFIAHANFLLIAFVTLVSLVPRLMGQILPTTPSQPGTFTIYGRVHAADGGPAVRAVVHIRGQRGLDRQAFSDDMGRYEIRDVPAGRYFITATSRTDPDQFTDPVEVDTGRSISNRLLINVYLRTKATVTETEERKGPVVSVVEATQHIPKEALKVFEKGVKFRSAGRTDRALESFHKAIDLYPAYFQALTERGHLLIATGRAAQALEDFVKALQVNEHYEPALRGSGLCKFQQGKFNDAIQDLEKALAVDPGIPTTYLFLGVSHIALGHHEPALLALQKALSMDPKGSARAHVHLANIYLKERRLEEAAREIRLYLEAEPDAPDATKLRAVQEEIRAQMSKPPDD